MIAWIDQDNTSNIYNNYSVSDTYTETQNKYPVRGCHTIYICPIAHSQEKQRIWERIANDLKSKEQILFLSRQKYKPIDQFINHPTINMKKLFSISGYLPRKIRSKYKHT